MIPWQRRFAVVSELAAECRNNLPLLSSKRRCRTFSRDSAPAQAVPSLPEMTHFGVGLEIIYSCDVSLPSCYLEWKAVLGPALLGSFQTTTVTVTEFAIESGTRSLKCSYFSFCVIPLNAGMLTQNFWSFNSRAVQFVLPTVPASVNSRAAPPDTWSDVQKCIWGIQELLLSGHIWVYLCNIPFWDRGSIDQVPLELHISRHGV